MKNYTYSGWKLNGFVALLVNLLMVAAMVYSIVVLATAEAPVVWAIVALVVLAIHRSLCSSATLCLSLMSRAYSSSSVTIAVPSTRTAFGG